MVRINLLLSLFTVALATSSTQRQVKKARKLGKDGVRIFYDRQEFKDFLEKRELLMEHVDFDVFNNATDLEIGENSVGSFDITIEHEDPDADVGSIDFDDNGDGYYQGIYYDKDVMEIKFENFDEGKIYAFAAEWDIEQDVDDLVDDDKWFDRRLSNGPPDYDDGWDKMLHMKIGRDKYGWNLVDELWWGETNFLGFFSPKGWANMEIYSPENEEPIDFVMSNVYVSVGTPTDEPDRPIGGMWGLLWRILSFLLTFDYSGLMELLDELTSAGDN
jgi:hypothetical protein